MVHPRIGTEGVTVNYSLNPTTFIEATYGRAGNELAACGPTPSFCGNTAVPTNDISNLNNAGLAGLPLLFPDALVLNKDYYAYDILTEAKVPFFDGTRILRVPSFSWGNRVVSGNTTAGSAPPNINFPGFLNINTTQDVVASLTKVMGRHTVKTGFYNSHSLKRENNVQGAADNFGTLNFQQDTVGTNPFDTSFGFANAAIGSFSSYAQASRYVEGTFTYNNTEGYVQDNWKVNNKLTLDYGVRLVHAQPQHDSPAAEWKLSAGQVGAVAGAAAVCRRLREQRESVHRHQPAGQESDHRISCWGRTPCWRSARSCRTPAT